MSSKKTPAYAYLRTSSATNTGADKDSDKRQLAAIGAFAAANGFEIVGTFYDAAVSGTDPIDQRPGMSDLLDAVLANGTRTILTESPDRFARDVLVQELGHKMLKDRGVELIPTTSPDYFTEDSPTAEMVRTILGAVAAFDRRTTVDKLKAARDRSPWTARRRPESGPGSRCGRSPTPRTQVSKDGQAPITSQYRTYDGDDGSHQQQGRTLHRSRCFPDAGTPSCKERSAPVPVMEHRHWWAGF